MLIYMNRLLFTGDKHDKLGLYDLYNAQFPLGHDLTKEDWLLIAGDMGIGFLQDCPDYFNKRYRIGFIDGNHEDFNQLYSYPLIPFKGGMVHECPIEGCQDVFHPERWVRLNEYDQPNSSNEMRPDLPYYSPLIHLMRGYVFEIFGKTIFCFGGGHSVDKKRRKEGRDWWPQELPNEEEYERAYIELDKVNWDVDYVMTHTSPRSDLLSYFGIKEMYDDDKKLRDFLHKIYQKLTFTWWFVGHYHQDHIFDKDKLVFLYHNIYEDIDGELILRSTPPFKPRLI